MTFDTYLEPDSHKVCPNCDSDNMEVEGITSGFACECETCLDCGKFYQCLGCYKADEAGY